MTCPKHPHVQQICPACQGSKGGKVLSDKKLKHLRRIGKLTPEKLARMKRMTKDRVAKQKAAEAEQKGKISLRASGSDSF